MSSLWPVLASELGPVDLAFMCFCQFVTRLVFVFRSRAYLGDREACPLMVTKRMVILPNGHTLIDRKHFTPSYTGDSFDTMSNRN